MICGGREPFEVASLLQEAAIEAGLHKDRTLIEPNELDAFVKAWETSQPGDLLLFFYTDFEYVERFFRKGFNKSIAEEIKQSISPWKSLCKWKMNV
ncbi:hypothetical protein RCO48_30150 [Peribacillus frigoritolerans]|nr:hypothetical protein [Peribacillus frigoritolerans]